VSCPHQFLTGIITGVGVFMLVDTGAMHNIININVACAIGLREQHIRTTILIGSGTKVTCRVASFSTPLRIDNEVSTIDVFLLDIGNDINVVLGTLWLASLRCLMWDFTSMELEYHDRGCVVTPPRAPGATLTRHLDQGEQI
jgi:predicted aspartyl protease